MAKQTIPTDKLNALNPFAKEKEAQKDRPKPFSSKGRPPLFDSLYPCRWRDVEFPIESMRTNLQQDLADHRYWGRPGANIESTGRGPIEFEAVIPFVNGIVPGRNERWGKLFPDAFVAFIGAMSDKSTGLLDTPLWKGWSCKPVSVEYSFDAQRRDGVQVTAKWIETEDFFVREKTERAPLEAIDLGALSLDADLPRAPLDDPPVFQETFEGLVNRITGVVDTTTSRLMIAVNKPAQIMFRLEKVKDSIERSKNTLTWPIQEACDKIESGVNALGIGGGKTEINPEPLLKSQPAKPIGRFETTTRMSLSMLQSLFPNNKVDDLIFLNPRLVARPTVPAGTIIRYYK